MIGGWLDFVSETENKIKFLTKLPANTFRAIYDECDPVWAGAIYNGVYFSEYEIYNASLERDECYEVLL